MEQSYHYHKNFCVHCLNKDLTVWSACITYTAILESAPLWSHLSISEDPLLDRTASPEVIFTSSFFLKLEISYFVSQKTKGSSLLVLSCQNAFLVCIPDNVYSFS